jgi:hypothetical protein
MTQSGPIPNSTATAVSRMRDAVRTTYSTIFPLSVALLAAGYSRQRLKT